jgi:hypothetical protein
MPSGSRERSEVRVERAVLLHDHDDVLDLLDAAPGWCASRRSRADAGRAERTGEGAERECHDRSDQDDALQPPPTLLLRALGER